MIREKTSRLTRRSLLAGLGLGVAAVGAVAAPPLKLEWTRKPGTKDSWWNRQGVSLSRADFDEWSRQVGARFALAGGIVASLVEVRPLGKAERRPHGIRDQAFMIVLESTGGTLPTGDRMIDVLHADAGAMKIYFSACRDTCGGRRLQAIFS